MGITNVEEMPLREVRTVEEANKILRDGKYRLSERLSRDDKIVLVKRAK